MDDNHVLQLTGAQLDETLRKVSQLSEDKLDKNKLDEAIATALTQAKESGEFDGDDGEAGVGIASIELVESSDTGNTYKITLTDGSNYNFVAPAGPEGPTGPRGRVGPEGPRGAEGIAGVGIASITFAGTTGSGNTYTIALTDGSTYYITAPVGPQGPEGPQGQMGQPGSPGSPGMDGQDGYTPVKGTDYWTAEDQAAIVSDVLEALPMYAGEVEDV